MKNIAERPMAIAFEKNFPEAIIATVTVLYGLMLSTPPDSLQYAQGYNIMGGIAPYWVWGLVFLVGGVVNLLGVLRRKGDLVRTSSKALAVLWMGLAFIFAVSSIFSPGWLFMLGFGVLFAGVSSEYRTKTKWFDGTDALGPDL